MVANQTKYSRFEQSSVLKCLVVEKCKPSEIYRRMTNVYGEVCFSQKTVYKWDKHGFATRNQSQKKNGHGVEELRHYDKEKALGTAVSKEGHADRLLRHKKAHHNWFPWKRGSHKQCFLLPPL